MFPLWNVANTLQRGVLAAAVVLILSSGARAGGTALICPVKAKICDCESFGYFPTYWRPWPGHLDGHPLLVAPGGSGPAPVQLPAPRELSGNETSSGSRAVPAN